MSALQIVLRQLTLILFQVLAKFVFIPVATVPLKLIAYPVRKELSIKADAFLHAQTQLFLTFQRQYVHRVVGIV